MIPRSRNITINKCKLELKEEKVEQSLKKLMTIPDDLYSIQPRADQVWNCDGGY